VSFWSLFNLPNILTLINLFSGCLAVVFVFNGNLDLVPYCTLVSLVADFFDGFAARFTKTFTDLGKQLDSLADMVSFGLVPGAVLYTLLYNNCKIDAVCGDVIKGIMYAAPAFVVTLFAALRLAKFNIDTRQSDGFIGLATPAATIFVAGILLLSIYPIAGISEPFTGNIALYAYAVVLSLLMVAELPMFSFKFKNFGWKGNEIRYLFIILSVVLIATLKFAAVSLIIVLYILISVAQKLISK
jgi:CDP-diacylglycerol---serine O-phosphatidyltransferase